MFKTIKNYLFDTKLQQLRREILSNHRIMESRINTLQRQIDKLKELLTLNK
jgi:chaperonin cofactor prefoldin